MNRKPGRGSCDIRNYWTAVLTLLALIKGNQNLVLEMTVSAVRVRM